MPTRALVPGPRGSSATFAAAEREGTHNSDGVVPVRNVGDMDGDGVQDKDTDGDEIPDEVEEGLDALLAAAACESHPADCDADHHRAPASSEQHTGDDGLEEFGHDAAEGSHADAEEGGKEEL